MMSLFLEKRPLHHWRGLPHTKKIIQEIIILSSDPIGAKKLSLYGHKNTTFSCYSRNFLSLFYNESKFANVLFSYSFDINIHIYTYLQT